MKYGFLIRDEAVEMLLHDWVETVVSHVKINARNYIEVEIYPPSDESEITHYVYWDLPSALTISSTIPAQIDAYVLKYLTLRNLTYQLREGHPGSVGAIASLFGAEFSQRLQDFAIQLQGPYGRLMRDSKYAYEHGSWQYNFLMSRANTIETGTSEIKRNIIAQRVLGLPR